MKTLTVLFSLLISPCLLAAPDPAISKIFNTPASAFDVYLFNLYESSKCNNVVKNNNFDEADLCVNAIKYDPDKNVLTAFFNIVPGAEAMDDFVELEEDDREIILIGVLQNTAKRFGAVSSWGLLHSTPLSHGRVVSIEDEKSFKAALAKRTTTVLSTSYNGIVYIATRHYDDKIEFFSSQ